MQETAMNLDNLEFTSDWEEAVKYLLDCTLNNETPVNSEAQEKFLEARGLGEYRNGDFFINEELISHLSTNFFLRLLAETSREPTLDRFNNWLRQANFKSPTLKLFFEVKGGRVVLSDTGEYNLVHMLQQDVTMH